MPVQPIRSRQPERAVRFTDPSDLASRGLALFWLLLVLVMAVAMVIAAVQSSPV